MQGQEFKKGFKKCKISYNLDVLNEVFTDFINYIKFLRSILHQYFFLPPLVAVLRQRFIVWKYYQFKNGLHSVQGSQFN